MNSKFVFGMVIGACIVGTIAGIVVHEVQGCGVVCMFENYSEEVDRAMENSSELNNTTRTLPDCSEYSWYECPYPLHLIAIFVILFAGIGIVLKQFH